MSKPHVRGPGKAGAISLVIASFFFIGILFYAVQVYVLPQPTYTNGGLYDTVQVANVNGQAQAFGAEASVTLVPPVVIYSSGSAGTIGSYTDTLSINPSIKSGTTQGYVVSCTIFATLNGVVIKQQACPSGVSTGTISSTLILGSLSVNGFDLYQNMVTRGTNTSAILQYYAAGYLTIYFLQGCGSPPCPVVHQMVNQVGGNQIALSSAMMYLSPQGQISVTSIQTMNATPSTTNTLQQQNNKALGGFGNFCPVNVSC